MDEDAGYHLFLSAFDVVIHLRLFMKLDIKHWIKTLAEILPF